MDAARLLEGLLVGRVDRNAGCRPRPRQTLEVGELDIDVLVLPAARNDEPGLGLDLKNREACPVPDVPFSCSRSSL